MTRDEIEMRIRLVQSQMAGTVHASTLATLNRCMDRLIMMEPDDETNQSMGDAIPPNRASDRPDLMGHGQNQHRQ